MSRDTHKEDTVLLGVFGSSYVHERHAEGRTLDRSHSKSGQSETAMAVVWLVFYAVIIGGLAFARGGEGGSWALASALLN